MVLRYGTIRTALIWYLGKDYTELLPAQTIGQGKSTIFEVRLGILMHHPKELEASIMSRIDGHESTPIVSPWRCNGAGNETLVDDLNCDDDFLLFTGTQNGRDKVGQGKNNVRRYYQHDFHQNSKRSKKLL